MNMMMKLVLDEDEKMKINWRLDWDEVEIRLGWDEDEMGMGMG